MEVLSIFANIVNENVLYYGENGSSRLQKGLNYGRNTEKNIFYDFFEHWKIKNSHFTSYNRFTNLLKTPYDPPNIFYLTKC